MARQHIEPRRALRVKPKMSAGDHAGPNALSAGGWPSTENNRGLV